MTLAEHMALFGKFDTGPKKVEAIEQEGFICVGVQSAFLELHTLRA